MEKMEIGKVHEANRTRNGVVQIIRLFNKKQRQIIKNAVENKPDDMTIADVLDLYEVNPTVYYSWLRNEKKGKKGGVDQLPNPLSDSFRGSNIFSSVDQLKDFYLAKSPELQEFIKAKFQEWLEHGLINQMKSKINPENVNEVAKAGNITVDELNSYLRSETNNLTYFSVDAIKRFLGI